MKGRDIIGAVSITDVFVGLGGDQPKSGHARAFWRDGDNPQAITLNNEKACWYDHRDHVGGGVLDLVRHVHGGERATAMQWLAGFVGVELDDRPITLTERRQYAQARAEAAEIVAWKERMLAALRAERLRWWNAYHASLRYVLDHGFESDMSHVMTRLHEDSEMILERLDTEIKMLAGTCYVDLLSIFRDQRRRAA